VGNILLPAVDRIEVVHIVADRTAGVDRIAVDHIGVDRMAAVVGGIHLLLPCLSVLSDLGQPGRSQQLALRNSIDLLNSRVLIDRLGRPISPFYRTCPSLQRGWRGRRRANC
jgi:hypothetical protein